MAALFGTLLPYMAYLTLLLRVCVGASFMAHGYPKLKSPKQTFQWTNSLGVPAAATYAAVVLEFFGGLSLIIGFLVPVVTFLIVLEMIGTTILKKTKMKGPYLMGQNAAAYEPDITYLLLAITIFVLGAGAYSVDALLGLN